MLTKNKNRKEDLKILVSLGSEYIPGTRFRLIFSTPSGRFNGAYFICEMGKNSELTNCLISDDNHVLCLLDNHNLPCGRLEIEVYVWFDDEQMPDGDLRLVSRKPVVFEDEDGQEYYIMLTEGESDPIPVVSAKAEIIGNLIKGDKGDAFKYEDFTPEQLDALKSLLQTRLLVLCPTTRK